MNIYGYARVSSKTQNVDRQLQELEQYSKKNKVHYEKVFIDYLSGASFNRKEYQDLMKTIRPGDRIVVKELDRLGRTNDYTEIVNELRVLREKDIDVVILDLPTFNIEDKALKDLLTNITIELFSYVASKEREKIRSRVKEGMENARKQGKSIGRPPVKLPKDFNKYYVMWKQDIISVVEFSKLLDVSRSTVYRYIKVHEDERGTHK